MASQFQRKGSYGIDAPYLLLAPPVFIALNIAEAIRTKNDWPLLAAAFIAACMTSGLYSSRRGKFVVWSGLLDGLGLRGDERILDIGCGRGAVMLLAAQRLTTGRAVGVDLWKTADQSGNSSDAAQRNAVAEGVADRVEFHTADMTQLPFENNSFDFVFSNVAIHNVKGREARRKAITEALRVLRPGGRLLIADIFVTREYVALGAELGLREVSRRNLGWRLWWGGPWIPTFLVTANKP
jgi:arsenite methyltransferase